MSPKVQPFADVCNHRFTMASADFSPFVVTHGLHTLFSSADETSLGTTRFFLSIYLPHLPQLIPSSYWTSIWIAILSLTVAWCDFCSSDQRFASTFLQIPPHDGHPWCSAISFPLLGRIRDFHPLETCAARRTVKKGCHFRGILQKNYFICTSSWLNGISIPFSSNIFLYLSSRLNLTFQ